MDANTRIKQLREELHRYNYQYYVLNASEINDQDYDAKYSELLALENRYPELVDSDSPTQRVGAPIKDVPTIRHSQRMLSLKNTYSAKEVVDFIKLGERVCLEPKIDGVSLKLIYKKGRLEQAITRGDGIEGEDATAAARTIRSIPLKLRNPANLTVVGEVYMTFSVFNDLNASLEAAGEDLFANPRNAAAGSLKLKDPDKVAARKLSFVAYGLHTELNFIKTQQTLTEYLESLDFRSVYMLPVVDSCQVVADCFTLTTVQDLEQRIAEADKQRKFLDVATDGLVFKINDLAKQRELGDGTKYPNHSCAFKYPPEERATRLLDITVQVGRTGKVTPVAELQPVLLSGTVVRRASLCNAAEIGRLDLNVGDDVIVAKSAEIIPKILAVARKNVAGSYQMPDCCPSCKSKLVKPEGFVDWFCSNSEKCDEQIFARLKHACSKAALDIDGCGEALIRDLMDHGVRSLYDLFTIRDVGFLKTAARNKFDIGREKAKQAAYWRKLHALSIEGLGMALCQEVAARWPSLDVALGEAETLRQVVGNVNFEFLIDWLNHNLYELKRLESVGFVLDKGGEATGHLAGKVFCVTGTLMSGSRNEIHDRIIAAGGIVKSSVTKTSNYLVAGEDVGKTKTDAAKKHGVPIITEEQLLEMLGDPAPA